MEDLHWLGADEILSRITQGELTAREVAVHHLDRIAGRSDNAFISLTPELALQTAEAVDAGRITGPLAGLPVAVKDILDVEGVPTSVAMASRRNSVARADATVVARLKAAGAVILGKTNMTEGAYAEHLPPYGSPVNPWNEAYWCGASSSGSGVAVAAGLAVAAIGTETGGSVRMPSATNGITGLKPTWGRVSRRGVHELAASLDTIGPMARSAEDVERIYTVIAGRDPLDPTSSVEKVGMAAKVDLAGFRIGVDDAFAAADVHADVLAVYARGLDTFRSLGAELVPVTMPDADQLIWDFFDICAVECAIAHSDHFDAHADQYGAVLADLIRRGRQTDVILYEMAQRRRRAFRGDLDAVLSSVDAVLSPVLSFPVPTVHQMQNMADDLIGGLHRFTCPFTISGHPAICFPAGTCSAGMPVNLQLVGAHFDEAELLRGTKGFQAATDDHLRHP